MSKLIPDIYTVSIEQVFDVLTKYFLIHLPCIAMGYGILFDEDGAWCSLCEPNQCEIAIDEQGEKIKELSNDN